MATNVPITFGTGQASIAGDTVAGATFQQIKVVDGTVGGSTGLIINADGTANVRLSGSVAAVNTASNSSVSGTVGASVIGAPPFRLVGYEPNSSSVLAVNPDRSINVSVVGVPLVSAVIVGGVSTSLSSSNGSVITVSQGSVAAVIIGGSIAASFTPPANQSVSGAVSVSNFPTTQNVSGSVVGFQGTNPWVITGSVQGTFTAAANQSVSGTVGASIIGQLPTGTGVLGSVAALQGTNPWTVTSSVAGGIFPISGSVAAVITNTVNVNAAGSVVAFQGTSPWVVNFQNSSILAVPQGSVITVWQNSSVLSVPVGSVITVLQSPSIVGTYAEDAAHTSGDKGVFALAVRNDTLSSVTSNDGDYSQLTTGPTGEVVTANAPYTKWVQGTADFRNGNVGGSIVLIAAQGSSIFTYITGVQIANMGSASVLVTLAGTGSTLGYSIAPAGGGSNIYYPNALKTPANATFAASLSGIASVLVSAQGFIAKI